MMVTSPATVGIATFSSRSKTVMEKAGFAAAETVPVCYVPTTAPSLVRTTSSRAGSFASVTGSHAPIPLTPLLHER